MYFLQVCCRLAGSAVTHCAAVHAVLLTTPSCCSLPFAPVADETMETRRCFPCFRLVRIVFTHNVRSVVTISRRHILAEATVLWRSPNNNNIFVLFCFSVNHAKVKSNQRNQQNTCWSHETSRCCIVHEYQQRK